MRNLLFFTLFLGVSILSVHGQPQTELIDEFGRITCDDFLARADNFTLALKNNPTAMGYAVIAGVNERPMTKLAYELLLNGAINTYSLDPDRIKLVRAQESGVFKMSLWLVPAGVEKPRFKETGWNLVLPPGTKPFIVHDDMEQICSTKGFEKVIMEFLEANPGARSNILLNERSAAKFEKEKTVILRRFPKEFRGRIRFFYAKNDLGTREYWLVPRDAKR
jgi:hypothetical protein